MNETLWHAAKQTVKDKHADVPVLTTADANKVDLKKAIQEDNKGL